MGLVSVMAKVGSVKNDIVPVSINPKFVSNIVYGNIKTEGGIYLAEVWLSGNNIPFFMEYKHAELIEQFCKVNETVKVEEVIVTPSGQH